MRKAIPYLSVFGFIFCIIFLMCAKAALASTQLPSLESAVKSNQPFLNQISSLNIPFVKNQGQVADDVCFYAGTVGGTLFVTRDGVLVHSLIKNDGKAGEDNIHHVQVIKERLIGAKNVIPIGAEKTETKVNYFKGSNKEEWKTDIESFKNVTIGEVYEHIDLELKAYGDNVEKIFTIHPNGNVKDLLFAIEGALSIAVTSVGELQIKTASGDISFSAPIAFQIINDRHFFV